MLKLNDVRKEVQAEIQSAELREIYRASTRVIRDINSRFPGVRSSEIVLTRKVVDTTENLSFVENAADNDDITTTTNFSSDVNAGYIAIVYGSDKNDGVYTVASIATTTVTLVGDDQLIDEGPTSCTIAFFEVKRREILSEKAISLTYVSTAPGGTITDAGGDNDFEAMGVSEGDIMVISGSTSNDAAISIKSVSKYTITIEDNTTITALATDLARVTIYDMSQVYSYSTERRELSFPGYLKELQWVFENDIELIPRDREYLEDSDNTDELMYGIYSRGLMSLPSWVMDTVADKLRIEVLKDISIVGKARPEAVIDAPQQLDGLILQGVFAHMYSLPKYFNAEQASRAELKYQELLKFANDQEATRAPNREYTEAFKF